MIRKAAVPLLALLITLPFLSACGGHKKTATTPSPTGDGDVLGETNKIQTSKGTAKGSAYTGVFELTANVKDNKCSNLIQMPTTKLLVDCKQTDGTITCSLAGGDAKGAIQEDASFVLATSQTGKPDGKTSVLGVFKVEGKFTSADAGTGKFSLNIFDPDKKNAPVCAASGEFTMARKTGNAKLNLSDSSDTPVKTKSYSNVIVADQGADLVAIAGENSERTVIRLANDQLSLARTDASFGPKECSSDLTEDTKTGVRNLSFACGDLTGDLTIPASD